MSSANPTAPNNGSNGSDTSSGTPSRRKRVLVVEGEGFTRLLLMVRLRMAGLTVDFASNGYLALKRLRERHPDALVLDLKLRSISGLDLIREARGNLVFSKRPIFVFTRADQLNRNARKELKGLGAKIFEKDTTSVDTLVANVAGELLYPKKAGASASPAAASASASPSNGSAPVQTPVSGNGSHKTSNHKKEAAPKKELPLPRELKKMLGDVQAHSTSLSVAEEPTARAKECGELCAQVCSLLSFAEASGVQNVARQSKALAGYLTRLCQSRESLTDNAVDTVRRSVQVLQDLSQGPALSESQLAEFSCVLVDECNASRASITAALTSAGFAVHAFDSSQEALTYLEANPVELVVANINMPELHGFQEGKIHELPLQEDTPVMFVPQLSSYEANASPIPSDTDTLAPLVITELVTEALNQVQSSDYIEPTVEEATEAAPQVFESKPAPAKPVLSNLVPTQPLPPPLPGEMPGTDDYSGSTALPVLPAELMGAEEALRQEDQQGSQIAASAQGYEDPHQHQSSAEPPDERRTILFIEDDPVVLKVYGKKLNAAGFRVESAEDGMAALDFLPRLRPDLVVLDLMLPKLHGLEVLKFIRGHAQLKDTPVIVLSNAYMEALASRAIQAGANKGVLKTQCSPKDLVEAIHELLGLPQPVPAILTGEYPQGTVPDDRIDTSLLTRRADLLQDAPNLVARIRQASLEYIKAAGTPEATDPLNRLYRRVRFLSSRATLCGMTKIVELAGAFEAMLFELVFQNSPPSKSICQTIAQAVDCLGKLVDDNDTAFVEPRTRPRMLVVDDDAVCTFAIAAALKRASFEVVPLQDSAEALRQVQEQQFELLILDINMPGMNGFELCEHVRQLPDYKSTPILFITANDELQNRARSVLVGGNDLMVKPVTPTEVILKCCIFLLQPGSAAANSGQHGEEPANFDVQQQPAEELESAEVANRLEAPALDPSRQGFTQDAFAGRIPMRETTPELAIAAAAPESPADEEGTQIVAQDSKAAQTSLPGELDPAAVQELKNRLDALQQELEHQLEVVAHHEGERQSLVSRIYSSEVELHRARARLERKDSSLESLQKQIDELAAAKTILENQLAQAPAQVEAANQARSHSENERDAALARASQLEHELQELSRARENLAAELAAEQQAKAAAATRCQELDAALAEKSHQLGEASEQLQALHAEHQALQNQLQQQLEAAAVAARESEHALLQARTSGQELEHEVDALTAALEEVKARLLDEEKTVRTNQEQIKALKAQVEDKAGELERQASEREKLQNEFWKTIENSAARAKQAEEAQQQADARCKELEKDLAEMASAHQALEASVTKEQLSAAESAKQIKALETQLGQKAGELEKQQAEHDKLQAQLKETVAKNEAVANQAAAAQQQADARCKELEKDLAEMANARQALEASVSKEQLSAAESAKQIKALETQLGQKAGELEKQQAEREKLQAQLKDTVEMNEAAAKEAAAAQRQADARCKELEKNLAEMASARQALEASVSKEQLSAAESAKQIKALETQLAQRAAELEKQQAERENLQAQLKNTVEKNQAAAKEAAAAQQQADGRCKQLERDLAEITAARQALEASVSKEQLSAAESAKQIKALETQLAQRAAELEKQQAERENLQAQLKDSVAKNQAAAKEAAAAQQQADARCKQLEKDLAEITAARQALEASISKEQLSAAESANQIKQLEAQLGQKAAELEKWQAEHEKLQTQLKETVARNEAAAKQATEAQQQSDAWCRELEQELTTLTRARKELEGSLGKEQLSAAESAKQIKTLESQLAEKAAELEKQQAEREKLQGQLKDTVAKNEATAKEAADARQQADARCKQLERDLAEMTSARQALEASVSKEQLSAAESAKQIKGLETQLVEKSAEFARQSAEATKLQAQLSDTLEKSAAASKQAEQARKELETRCAALEAEVEKLQQARTQLNEGVAREQQSLDEATKRVSTLEKQLAEKAADAERAKAEIERLNAEHEQALAALRRQIEEGEAERLKAQDVAGQLQAQVASLQQAGQEIQTSLARQQKEQAESGARIQDLQEVLARQSEEVAAGKVELEKALAARAQAEEELRKHLAEAVSSRDQTQAAAMNLENELAGLRQAREELANRLEQERQLQGQNAGRLRELEAQLAEKSAELDRVNEKTQTDVAERARVENELKQQVAALSAVHEGSRGRLGALEQENAAINRAREELIQRLAREQHSAVESDRRVQELEKRLRDAETAGQTQILQLGGELEHNVLSLARVTAELEKERGERQRGEQRAAAMASTLQDLHRDLSRAVQSDRANQQRIQNLEQLLRQREEEIVRRATELRQEKTGRQLAQEQLQSAQQLNADLRKNISLFDEARTAFKSSRAQLETNLEAAVRSLSDTEGRFQQESAERRRLAEALQSAQASQAELAQKARDLENQLRAAQKTLAETEANLQKESLERLRLSQSLDSTRARAQGDSQSTGLELSRLRSALQLEQAERRRLETQLVRTRHATVEAGRAKRVFRNDLLRQVNDPIGNLYHSARRLLQQELSEDQKELAQSMLRDVLMVRAVLEQGDRRNGEQPVTAQPQPEPASAPAAGPGPES